MITYEDIGEELEKGVPEFKERVRQHVLEQRGQILPHVLFEDFAAYFLEHLSLSETNPSSKVILHKCARLIEDLLEADEIMVRNVVTVSFLEYTFESDKPWFKAAQDYFLPKTKAMLIALENGID